MAKPKQTKISFRLDDVRSFRMAEYQARNKIKEKAMTNTQFMIKAIDNLLESDDSNITEEIQEYESKLIKIISGYSRRDFEKKEEYLKSIKDTIKNIEKIIKTKKQN